MIYDPNEEKQATSLPSKGFYFKLASIVVKIGSDFAVKRHFLLSNLAK